MKVTYSLPFVISWQTYKFSNTILISLKKMLIQNAHYVLYPNMKFQLQIVAIPFVYSQSILKLKEFRIIVIKMRVNFYEIHFYYLYI